MDYNDYLRYLERIGAAKGDTKSSSQSACQEPTASDIKRELQSVKSATFASKYCYDNNIISISDNVKLYDLESPIMCALSEWLANEISLQECSSDYDDVMDNIDSYIYWYLDG